MSTGPCQPNPTRVPLRDTWQQTRLGYQNAWPVTRGAGVLVAVIDTGVDRQVAQLRHARILRGVNTIGTSGTQDCDTHGTQVTSVIAAQQVPDSAFLGVAPDATILPIKQTNTQADRTGNAVTLADGIDAAVAAGAQVANVSVYIPLDDPRVRAAVRRAQRAGMVIVAAVGNGGTRGNLPTWPASYSTQFRNVIAVSAINRAGAVPAFPERGRYVDVAAPGTGFEVPTTGHGFAAAVGTSFAAPYVTGTVALMLAADPSLTPAQVRARLEQTADPPPVAVPSPRYGYGVVNSYLAVTTLVDDAAPSPPPSRAAPLPPPAPAAAPDRHLQHLGLALGVILLGLTVLVVAGAAVLRAASPGAGGARTARALRRR